MIIKQSDDTSCVVAVKTRLAENNGYCPCKIERTADTKCMCKEFREKITQNESCTCHCGLYVAEND